MPGSNPMIEWNNLFIFKIINISASGKNWGDEKLTVHQLLLFLGYNSEIVTHLDYKYICKEPLCGISVQGTALTDSVC